MPEKTMWVTCDAEAGCGHVFEVKEFKIKRLKQGIEKVYFRCPKCKHDYVAYFTNKKIRQLQKSIKVEQDEEKQEQIMQEIKDEMKWLSENLR